MYLPDLWGINGTVDNVLCKIVAEWQDLHFMFAFCGQNWSFRALGKRQKHP
jgi:hypothetical protein